MEHSVYLYKYYVGRVAHIYDTLLKLVTCCNICKDITVKLVKYVYLGIGTISTDCNRLIYEISNEHINKRFKIL